MQTLNTAYAAEESGILDGLTSYWTERSESYSDQNVEEMNNWKREAWRNLILKYAPQKKKLRILDVGTGPGFFAMTLALAGHDVVAIDVTEGMLDHARENAKAYGADVTFLLQRGENLPCPDESFDLIVSRNVIWNLEFPECAFREWERVLAPGGRMVYFDANWYLYLFDEEMMARRKWLRGAFKENHPDHNDAGNMSQKRVHDLEMIAYSLPLSREHRPQWDCKMLKTLDMRVVEIIDNIGPYVLSEIEQERDSASPMFMVCAEKEMV